MRATSIYTSSKYVPEFISNSIGDELGYGVHGQVFDLKGPKGRVIKFTKLYDNPIYPLDNAFRENKKVYQFLMKHDYPCFAKVFDMQFIAKEQRKTVDGLQDFIIYYSILEKLLPLEEDEKKVFKTICAIHNQDIENNKPVPELLDELSEWFSFDKERAIKFWNALKSSPIHHNDVHRRNIMKDSFNNYKLVDFDKATLLGD
jgi:hypothetical protein